MRYILVSSCFDNFTKWKYIFYNRAMNIFRFAKLYFKIIQQKRDDEFI